MTDCREPAACAICGGGETESDLHSCVHCERLMCDDCIDWCHAEGDEPNGDWLCEECQDWIPLTRWQRFLRFWSYYVCPWRPCMVCGRRFWNWGFWRWSSLHWGIPEYCSWACVEAEEEPMT